MNSFEFELWIEQYKAIIKETGERLLFPDEMTKLDKNIDYMPEEYKEAYKLATEGNYSKFEKLPHLLRNYLGAKALKKFRDEYGENPSLEDKEVRQYLEENAMNAALRAGISAEKNAIPHRGDSTEEKIITEKDAEETRKYAKTLDSYMNGILMKRTMMPPSDRGKEELQKLYGDAVQREYEKNMARQLVMAKAMLLAQIGKYDVISKNGLSDELNVPIYETLVHGNRTNFVLPVGESSQDVLDAFMGEKDGAAGIGKRTAATHSVKRRAIKKNGILSSVGKEERTYSPLKVFSHQYGMDIAAGGLGETGPNTEVILGKGDSGHMYMRAQAGDAKHCGSLLIGIEGSAPGEGSFLGNEHGITAKSAKQSAFLADKAIVGKKVGGRQVDLSGISASELSEILNTFSEKYTALQQGADTLEGREKLAKVNDMLMGKHMDINALVEMFTSIGMTDKKLPMLLAQARKGYLSGVKTSEITEEEFKQNIRSKTSQEKACSIAEARFKYADNDIKLAVGAIKELIFTHETRSLGWKILHPIKNYRENKTISSLIGKLATDKGMTTEDITNAIMNKDDTFTMNWGSGLSNDRDVIQFVKRNAQVFKQEESKLDGVLKQACDDIRKDGIGATAANKNVAATQATANVRGISNDDREKIKVIYTENKTKDLSNKIDESQPTRVQDLGRK